jgi:hypothetical protein
MGPNIGPIPNANFVLFFPIPKNPYPKSMIWKRYKHFVFGLDVLDVSDIFLNPYQFQ